jgi:hypothetical protein
MKDYPADLVFNPETNQCDLMIKSQCDKPANVPNCSRVLITQQELISQLHLSMAIIQKEYKSTNGVSAVK